MTTTTTNHETISAASLRTNITLERPGTHYTYLGEDTEGGHHHLEEESSTIYVTDQPPERYLPDDAVIYWFRIHGKTEHVEELPTTRIVPEWVAYVDHKRGWTKPPLLIDASIAQSSEVSQ